MVPFQKRVIIPQQKWYHFRKGSKIVNKNGTIPKKGQKSSKNGTILEEDQKSSTKMVPFQKRVKNRQKSSTKMVPFQSENGQNSSTKMVPLITESNELEFVANKKQLTVFIP